MKYVLVDGTNYILMPLSVLHNPYGDDIPQEYAYAEKYPVIVLDQNGNFLMGYEKLFSKDDKGAFNRITYSILSSNAYDASTNTYTNSTTGVTGVIILLRRDYVLANDDKFDNLGHLQGEVIFDLCGYSITQPKESSGSGFFLLTAKRKTDALGAKMFPTTITVKNGSIYTYKSSIATLQTWDGLGDGTIANKVFTLNFDNVKFGLTNGATVSNLLMTVDNQVNGSMGGTAPFVLNFKDCEYDLKTNSNGKTITLFKNGASAAKYAKCTLTVEGGKVIVSDPSKVTFVTLDTTSGSSVTFKNGTDGAFALELPTGVTAPATEFDINGGKAVFVKVSENDGTVTYKLRPVATVGVDFVPKMSITLSSELIMNVYVPANNSLQKFVFNDETYNLSDFGELEFEMIDGKKYYIVRVALPAAVGAKDVKLIATIALDNATANATYTFSIPRYAEKVIADKDSTEEEITLVKDVLLYVKSAYIYFGTNDAKTIAKIDAILGGYSAKPTIEGSATSSTSGFKSVTFVLDATPAMRFYLADGVEAEACKFYIDGKEIKTKKSQDGTYVDTDVYAYALCETVSYTIEGGASGSFHINSYYSYVSGDSYTGSDKAELVNLTECFWNYLESARAYRNSVIK